MTSDTDLPTEATPGANGGGACQAYLGSHDGVLTDEAVVGYLHEVVELDTSADDRIVHDSSVDTGIRPDLDISLY